MDNNQYEAALNTSFWCDDLDEELTVRGYLRTLLQTLWDEQEGFSGKRPFGNSGWEYSLYAPLIKEGFIKGSIDEDGYVETIGDRRAAHAFVSDLILYVFKEIGVLIE